VSARRRRLGLFVLVSTLFGGTFVAARAGLAYFPPLLFVAFRFDLAAVLLLGYVALTREHWLPRTHRDLAGVFVTGVPALGLSNALLFTGQQYTTSAVAAVVFSLAPVLTPLFSLGLLPEERLSARGALGLLVGLAGVGIVVRPDPGALLAGDTLGRVLLLGGATSVALGSVLVRRTDASLPKTVTTAWGLVLGALTLHLVSAGLGESLGTVEWTPTALASLGYLAVFAAAIAYVAYFTLLDEAGPIRTNLINYAIPVVTAVLGWLMLGETLVPATALGFLVIACGFVLLEYHTLAAEWSASALGRRFE
jgi:drug/metabolite transporter (DMT)-like permease